MARYQAYDEWVAGVKVPKMEAVMAKKGKGKGKGGKYKTAARLTIDAPGAMTEAGRRDIVAWLRQSAAHLAKHGAEYTEGRFRGSFNYT